MKTKRKKILLADCDEDVLIALEKLLEDAGFDTRTAWTAMEALRLVDSSAFDLALVNEYLPDAKCEEVVKALQRRGKSTLCIVMQPRAPRDVDFMRFEGVGARDIVCKRPYRQIVELVRECFVGHEREVLAA